MGERKVLNKYYPPDFDPAKIPRRKMARDRQFTVRLMAPFNMRCLHCGEYIYKGKKFNAQKETALNEEYLGLQIFRFYIRCPRCATAITFKTDPKNTDYVCETGATRNFENWRITDDTGEEALAQEEFEEQNPMAALENRTKESKQEMDILDALEEIKDANARKYNVDIEAVLQAKEDAKKAIIERRLAKQEAEDDAVVRAAFGGSSATEEDAGQDASNAPVKFIRRLESSSEDENEADGTNSGGILNRGGSNSLLSDDKDTKVEQRPTKRAKKQLEGRKIGGILVNQLVRKKGL